MSTKTTNVSKKEPRTKAEVVFKSSEENPFMTVKKARGYYYYAERLGVDSLFFILYDGEIGKYCLITESKPPLDEVSDAFAMMTTAFGGSIDMPGKTKREIVQQEVLEEAGYDIELDRIIGVGATLVSTQMSQIAHGYVVDVTGIAKTHTTEGEDPESNCDGMPLWLTMKEVIANSDWKGIFCVVKLGEIMDDAEQTQKALAEAKENEAS